MATSKRKRPKAPAKVRKDEVVRMRVTAELKAALTEAAAREGLELSAWLRQAAMRAAGFIGVPRDRTS